MRLKVVLILALLGLGSAGCALARQQAATQAASAAQNSVTAVNPQVERFSDEGLSELSLQLQTY
jgi:outer membrane lipoprotein-sorting protein